MATTIFHSISTDWFNSSCYFKSIEDQGDVVLQFLSLYLWMFLAFIFSIVFVYIVGYRLYRYPINSSVILEFNNLNGIETEDEENPRNPLLENTARGYRYYAFFLTPLISQPFLFAVNVSNCLNRRFKCIFIAVWAFHYSSLPKFLHAPLAQYHFFHSSQILKCEKICGFQLYKNPQNLNKNIQSSLKGRICMIAWIHRDIRIDESTNKRSIQSDSHVNSDAEFSVYILQRFNLGCVYGWKKTAEIAGWQIFTSIQFLRGTDWFALQLYANTK